MRLKNKQILVMGLGIHGGGVGVVKYLVDRGAQVRVTDLKSRQELQPSLQQLEGLPIQYTLGEHRQKDFQTADMVVRNPGVPQNSSYLAIARKNNIPIEMELSLFLAECPSEKIIGVTGTKGKTTTSWMIYQILSQTKDSVVIAGNMGRSLLAQLPEITPQSWVVLELSSWQLECLADKEVSLPYAVLTNIYPDHLNRYDSLDDYIAAKKLIFRYQSKRDQLFLNKSDSRLEKMAATAPGQVHLFSADQLPKEIAANLLVLGQHNRTNAAAARQVAKTLGVPHEQIQQALVNFSGIPHRLEKITAKEGVVFYNDTTATNPAAARAALHALNKPIRWIAGGADKNLDFAKLSQSVPDHVKKVYLLTGSATPKLKKQLQTHRPQLELTPPSDNFKQTVQLAWQEAQPGDIVLLSPAAASFGMFANEFDRGEQFKKIATGLHGKE